MPRPVPPRERKTLDKFIDYLVGEGPQNRYALICRYCHSHNGMAMREEFEYISEYNILFGCLYLLFRFSFLFMSVSKISFVCSVILKDIEKKTCLHLYKVNQNIPICIYFISSV